jgi:putative ABC transport system permease protein
VNTVVLTPFDLALAAALLIVNGIISIAFGLRLERSLAIAAIRMVVQLAAVGYVLKFVFERSSPGWTALLALTMVVAAGLELTQRQERRPRGWLGFGLGHAALLLAGSLATLYAATVVITPSPWYAPRYVLPVLGMVLGNTLTSVSLVLQTLYEGVERERGAIEARMALGATRLQAFSSLLRTALRTATTPLVNTMAVAGIVTLPGMMAGQILVGADPSAAAKYQIMIMFVLAGASGLGALSAALGSVYLMTDSRHRLRMDRLTNHQSASAAFSRR